MSSIITIIESIVDDIPSKPNFIHGQKGWQNVESDESAFPAIYLEEPLTSDDTFHQGGLVEESYPLQMMFLDKTELDQTPEQLRPIVDAMRALRRQFIIRLKTKKNTNGENIVRPELVTNIRTIDVYNVFDVNISGVIVTFNVTPLNSDSVCVS